MHCLHINYLRVFVVWLFLIIAYINQEPVIVLCWYYSIVLIIADINQEPVIGLCWYYIIAPATNYYI